MNQNKNKSHFRFDEWDEVVDCNDCKHYHDETCNGAPQGSQRLCKAFLATRRVDLPLQVNSCLKGLKRLRRDVTILQILLLGLYTLIFILISLTQWGV